MLQNQFRIKAAHETDADQLAELRVVAMRPSLEAAGRFDPQRARDRFLASFVAADTQIIYKNGEMAGFFVVRQRTDHLYLDHLYVLPNFQGAGIGRRIIDGLKDEAQSHMLPIRLMALKNSPANTFYQSCGFEPVSSDELDTQYVWHPGPYSS